MKRFLPNECNWSPWKPNSSTAQARSSTKDNSWSSIFAFVFFHQLFIKQIYSTNVPQAARSTPQLQSSIWSTLGSKRPFSSPFHFNSPIWIPAILYLLFIGTSFYFVVVSFFLVSNTASVSVYCCVIPGFWILFFFFSLPRHSTYCHDTHGNRLTSLLILIIIARDAYTLLPHFFRFGLNPHDKGKERKKNFDSSVCPP